MIPIFVETLKVKQNFSIVLFFITGFLFSQEFGAKFITIDENTLPQVFVVENSFFVKKYSKISFSETLGMNSTNYWKPVSMEDAMNKQESYLNRKNTTQTPITAETLGFRKSIKTESSVKFEIKNPYYPSNSHFKNDVYRDASLPSFYNPFYSRTGRISNF